MDVAIPTATYLHVSIGRSGLLWFYMAALVPGRFKDCIESIFVVLHYI